MNAVEMIKCLKAQDQETEVKVFIVLEEDRGLGVDVVAVFLAEEPAAELAATSSHFWYVSSVVTKTV